MKTNKKVRAIVCWTFLLVFQLSSSSSSADTAQKSCDDYIYYGEKTLSNDLAMMFVCAAAQLESLKGTKDIPVPKLELTQATCLGAHRNSFLVKSPGGKFSHMVEGECATTDSFYPKVTVQVVSKNLERSELSRFDLYFSPKSSAGKLPLIVRNISYNKGPGLFHNRASVDLTELFQHAVLDSSHRDGSMFIVESIYAQVVFGPMIEQCCAKGTAPDVLSCLQANMR